jgi:hypothetical protein
MSLISKIKLNQIFSTNTENGYVSWRELTGGHSGVSIDIQKGMPYFKSVNGRIPLINFHTNPFKEEARDSPWRDEIFQDEGRVIYFGDNKSNKLSANESRGNKKVLEALPQFSSKDRIERLKAPPIIITKTINVSGRTGYRQFVGVGLISRPPKLVQQYEISSEAVFSNYQFEIDLITLLPDDYFNFDWIDDRRNPNISDEDSLKKAPKAWKKWVSDGVSVIDSIKLKIRNYRVVSALEQREMPDKNKIIIDDLLNVYYPDPTKDGVRFEALASFITSLYFQEFNYTRGWITQGTGDRGVDFVGRLDIGDDDFSKTSVIVLGQSKRYKNSISGERLTRVASRLTRGYIGVVVTLDTFTENAQREIRDDKLPIILINGRKASDLLLNYMHSTKTNLKDIVNASDIWAKYNIGTEHYESILNK